MKKAVQIRGCDFWLKIIERYCCVKSFYLIGGQQNVIEETVLKLKREYSGINIVNYRNGYFNEVEKDDLFRDIKEKKPDVVFVATVSPKQEFLMEEMLTCYPALYMGLGGSFDVYVDHVPMAPKWLIKIHMEWAYRLFKEPWRLKRLIRSKNIFKYIKFLFRKGA
jgi:UDP-N-acetyl-D-mannosaminouronate:lipid I N-acetyl-D-mannosaminouronosyltransferase